MEYRYRKTIYRCSDCKKQFDKLRKFPTAKYPEGTDLPFPKKDPNCPYCAGAKKISFKSSITDDNHKHINPDYVPDPNDKRVFSMGKTNFTKAMDATAEIVMKDYNLTDLQDNLRAGDSMAPKLAPELERQVDNVFKPQKPIMGQGGASSLNKALTSQINSGRYASQSGGADIVQKVQNSGYKVPTNEIFNYDNRGKPN